MKNITQEELFGREVETDDEIDLYCLSMKTFRGLVNQFPGHDIDELKTIIINICKNSFKRLEDAYAKKRMQ